MSQTRLPEDAIAKKLISQKTTFKRLLADKLIKNEEDKSDYLGKAFTIPKDTKGLFLIQNLADILNEAVHATHEENEKIAIEIINNFAHLLVPEQRTSKNQNRGWKSQFLTANIRTQIIQELKNPVSETIKLKNHALSDKLVNSLMHLAEKVAGDEKNARLLKLDLMHEALISSVKFDNPLVMKKTLKTMRDHISTIESDKVKRHNKINDLVTKLLLIAAEHRAFNVFNELWKNYSDTLSSKDKKTIQLEALRLSIQTESKIEIQQTDRKNQSITAKFIDLLALDNHSTTYAFDHVIENNNYLLLEYLLQSHRDKIALNIMQAALLTINDKINKKGGLNKLLYSSNDILFDNDEIYTHLLSTFEKLLNYLLDNKGLVCITNQTNQSEKIQLNRESVLQNGLHITFSQNLEKFVTLFKLIPKETLSTLLLNKEKQGLLLSLLKSYIIGSENIDKKASQMQFNIIANTLADKKCDLGVLNYLTEGICTLSRQQSFSPSAKDRMAKIDNLIRGKKQGYQKQDSDFKHNNRFFKLVDVKQKYIPTEPVKSPVASPRRQSTD